MELAQTIAKHRERLERVLAVALVFLAGLSAVALFTYDGGDWAFLLKSSDDGSLHNWIGPFGSTIAEYLLQLFGVGAWLIPLAMLVGGIDRMRRRPALDLPTWALLVFALVCLLTLVGLLFGRVRIGGEVFAGGGAFGRLLGGLARGMLGERGALATSSLLLATVVVFVARPSFLQVGAIVGRMLGLVRDSLVGALRRQREERAAEAAAAGEAAPAPSAAVSTPPRPAIEVADPEPAPAPPRPAPAPVLKKPAPPPKPAPSQAVLPMDPGKRGYSLPGVDLLREPEPQSIESEHELLERAKQITTKLQEFNVGGTVVAVHPGPVVTTFEFKPDAGVKYSKIVGMTDDLSLALKAESVRIARMPQKSTVGIEVPNRRKETIFPRDLIGSESFRACSSKLPLAIGKDITGQSFTAELDKMPHLLIAGATGAGKSVGLNGMIISMLYRATPRDLRFIMIDTKMIELGVYADIPHLLIPVVTEPKLAATSLKWAVKEMESRYRKLASLGVRNILQFNERVAEDEELTMVDKKTGEDVPLDHLPYIVVVIDELADLMMVSSSEVEEAIMRLAQMARAVGIHLILATQRPSVDVITGTIKANFPSRIAYRVSQRVDSRTIIDQQGAEHLLGRGDMLFLATGASRVQRLHGPYITETEITRVVSSLKKMAEPVYDESVLTETDERGGPGGEEGPLDEMYYDAVRTVLQEGKCSITLIQRRLQLGYARAARIVDMMEQLGVVGPGEGSKPREILVGQDYLEAHEARTS